MRKTLNDVLSLSLSDFLKYIKTVDYGYKDLYGKIHIGKDFDLAAYPYTFSSPAEVVSNNCAWCWDICELIRDYCSYHGIPVSVWFYEFNDNEIHQTHTQAFIELEQLWYPFPDNSDPHSIEDFQGKALDEVCKEFQGYFIDFIQHICQSTPKTNGFIFNEYDRRLKAGMSDEEVLSLLRKK